jgi:protein phosphatase
MQGDQLLLCSDGLTRDMKPAEILATVRREKDPQAAAERLVELANAAGGLDNTTVILVSVQHGASETPMQRVWNWLVS